MALTRSSRQRMRIAHVSTFPQMRCGIAFYAADLIQALPDMEHRKYVLHYGQNLTADAAGEADAGNYKSVRDLARAISRSNADVISLQHEFGIWGGAHGEHILDFLNEAKKPIVSTLHTTFRADKRVAVRRLLLKHLVEQSRTVFVFSPESRATLCPAVHCSDGRVAVVAHGVPDVPFVRVAPPDPGQPWRFCALGFYRPGKGMEEILDALSALKKDGFPFKLVIAGSAQPQFDGQRDYVRQLHSRIARLRLAGSVDLKVRFLSRSDQARLIQNSHAGLFTYQDRDHASSGTIPMVLASGRPVISTPFEFALAKQREFPNAVTVAAGFRASDIRAAILQFAAVRRDYIEQNAALYRDTRAWLWGCVGATYRDAFGNRLDKRPC